MAWSKTDQVVAAVVEDSLGYNGAASASQRRRHIKPVSLAVWLIGALSSVLIAYHDPFGLSSRTKIALQAAFDPIIQAHYPATEARRVGLIMPTYDDVAQGRLHFPIWYSELAQIVDIARHAHAKAVFLDYEFSLPPVAGDNLSDLVQAIRQADSGGVKIFSGPVAATPAMAELREVVQQVDVDQEVDHPLEYALTNHSPHSSRAPSAAMALYQSVCIQPSPFSECDARLLRSLSTGNSADLAMQFGEGFPQEQAFYVPDEEVKRCRSASMINRALSGLRGHSVDAPCERHLSIPASAALEESLRAQVVHDLSGRVIIVGPGPNLGDDHDWPGVGRLPGAVFHANAIDNLLTWGNAYRRWPKPLFGPNIALDDVVALLLVLLTPPIVWLILKMFLHEAEGVRARRAIAYRALFIWVVASLSPVVLAFWLFSATRWAPACALAVLALGAPLTAAVCGEELAKRLSPLDSRRTAFNLMIAAAALLAFVAFPLGLALTLSISLCVLLALSIGASLAPEFRHLRRWLGDRLVGLAGRFGCSF